MNPLLMAYANDAHFRAEQYAGTTAAFVLGRVNATQDAWQRCRDRGSEIYKYENLIERPDNRISAVDEEIYMGDHTIVPLWPYLDANGQQRCHKVRDESGALVPIEHKFTDIRPGSAFVNYYLDHVAEVIRSKRYTGLMLDGFGGQLWGSADWDNWPRGEREEWTAAAVDLAHLLDEVRRAEDPNFIKLGNNTWQFAPEGEQYMNGIVSENAKPTNLTMQRMVGRPFSDLGNRRVFALSRTKADALAWAAVPGVTHVCNTEENLAANRGAYSYPTTPVVGYSAIKVAAVDVSAELASLREANNQLKVTNEALSVQLGAASDGLNAALADLTQARSERDAAATAAKNAEASLAQVRQAARVWHQLGATE